MTREEQDKFWNEHSREVQQDIIERYSSYDTSVSVLKALKESLEYTYGKHNLQHKLTYEDVARELFIEKKVYYFAWDEDETLSSAIHCKGEDWYKASLNCTSKMQGLKIKAINMLLNVAKYLNGDWKPDWENETEAKWYIEIMENEIDIDYTLNCNSRIVYFRTEELAKQAIQILGEETIKLALSSDY